MIKCIQCDTETSNPKFCTKSCAAKYNNKLRMPRSEESRLKTSVAMSGRRNISAKNPDLHPQYRKINFHECICCNKLISNPKCKTCSITCRDNIRALNGTLKRRIKYKEEVFQSNWEVEIAKFLDRYNINWSHPCKRLLWFDSTLQKNRTYLPDFFLVDYNIWLDVKNPIKQLQDADKIKQLVKIFPLIVGDVISIKEYVAQLVGLEPT